MRILHIFSDPALTHGASMFEYRISQQLRDSDIFFDYLVTGELSPEDAARYAAAGSVVHRLALDTSHGLLIRELKANLAYYRFFKTHPYQIVYADTENALRAAHLLMARFAGVRVRILHAHNTALQTESRASAKLARLLRRLFSLSVTDYFACSEAAAEWLFPPKVCARHDYEILKNGVDLNAFRLNPEARSRVRDALGLSGTVLGHIGRFMPQKNHARLLEIFAAVRKTAPEARLLLIGGGPMLDEMKEKARALGVAEYVCFAGNVQDVPAYLSAMDVFVMPSLFEGLPITGVEAQANELPCVFSDAITREIGISSLAEFLPLAKSDDVWAEKILAAAAGGRRDASAEIAAAGYSVGETANRLKTFYEEKGGEIRK